MELTVNSFFCGAGGFDLGFIQAGFTIVGAWDFDKFAVASYRANIGEHVKQMDIREMTWKDVPMASVWTFGFPCQDLSVAGKQAGLFEGKRSGLFFEVMRLLNETLDNKPENAPLILLAENVKGLKPYLGVLEEEYRKRGYKMQYRLYNSKYWGVPQNRERYFVVGTQIKSGVDFIFPEEQREYIPKLSSVLETEVDEKYYISDEKAKRIIEQAMERLERLGKIHATITPDRVDKRQNGRRAKEEEEMFTLTAQDIHGVIQSVYTDKDGCAYACNARYYKGPSYADVGRGRNTQIIEAGTCLRWQNKKDGIVPDYIAPTLRASGGTDIRKKPLVVEEPKIEVVGTLEASGTTQEHNNRVHDPNGISPTVTAVAGGTHHIKVFDYSKYRVRKLTPTEYGRLQGFPMDTWKQVVSDTQAYKQFGNAVTVPVAKAIANAIKSALEASK